MNPIDFKGFRKALEEYVKNTTEFKDVQYEGSGISQLLNILSYTGTYLGYYLEANDNEHYLQTAQTRTALSAGAKRNGYVVRGRKASKAEVYVEKIVDSIPDGSYVHISRDWNVVGVNKLTDAHRNFLFTKDIYLYDYEKLSNGNFRFYSDKPYTLHQGSRKFWRFQMSADRSQRFVIKDDTIDIDTIRVFVKNTLSDKEIGDEYLLSKNIVKDYGKDNKVFNIVTAENGWYEIFFGNDIVAKKPELNQYIVCEYMSPSGEDGDGCTTFKLGGFNLTTASPSFGGSEGESNESIRYNAQYAFRRQNRLFTVGDVKSILMQEFRNIKSINVWGGEDNTPKYYGKTMIAIKPNNSETLSQGAKIDIKKRLLDEYGYLGMDIQLIDPEYVNVDMVYTIVLKDTVGNITKDNVEQELKALVKKYSKENLNQFGYYLNDLELNSIIKENVPAIDSVYSHKRISKMVEVNTNNSSTYTVNLSNPIESGTVFTQFEDYNYKWTMTDDGKGKLVASAVNEYGESIVKSVGEVDYQKGVFLFNLPLTSGKNYPFYIDFNAKSVKPNIYSKQLNVVRIRTVEVHDVLQTQE